MTSEDAYLQAILASPEDDAPRLLFADWLEERGDPDRAEFIRVQIALAGRGAVPPRLRSREQELLGLYSTQWAAAVSTIVAGWEFRRGFIDEVHADCWEFLDGADELFRRAPVRRLRLSRGPGTWHGLSAALAECAPLANLRELDLAGSRLGATELSALLVSEHLTNLTTLNLSHCDLGDGGVRALTRWPPLTGLTELDLRGNGITAGGVRALAAVLERRATGGAAPRLRSLRLDDNSLGDAGRRAVLASPLLRRAARLPAPPWKGRVARKK